YEIAPNHIQELWLVSSKLTFGVEATTDRGLLRQLQESMEELKQQIKR
ncbi:MAG: DNA-binding protein, partial [Flavobacteriaceae bacterium]|nr:DNA-binding protein [Flavobacteriaceae bacterium]